MNQAITCSSVPMSGAITSSAPLGRIKRQVLLYVIAVEHLRPSVVAVHRAG